MRLATDPRIVRLPASVEAMARTSQARRESANEAMSGLKSRTAGTLETRFESTAVTAVSTAGRWRFAAAAQCRRTPMIPECSSPSVMTNRPAKRTSSPPVDLAIDLLRLHAPREERAAGARDGDDRDRRAGEERDQHHGDRGD